MSARRPSPSAPPGTTPLGAALEAHGPLARLLERVRASERGFAAIAPLLPPGLREQVQPGPLEEDGSWLLLAASGAAASKLRQLLPRLEARLREQGHPATVLRVRVQPPAPKAAR